MKQVAQSTIAIIKMPCPVCGPARHRFDRSGEPSNFDFIHEFGLMPFGSLNQFKFDFLAFKQRFITIALNRRVMDKDVFLAFGVHDEAIAFAVIEPFNFALFLFLP